MAMNDEELAHVAEALSRRLLGQGLQNVWQPARDRVVMGIGDAWILAVPRGGQARVHTIRTRPRNPDRPYSFQGACRAHLVGPLTAVDKAPGDRVLDLHFGPRRLHLRLTGRSGGLWLLEGERVLAAYDGPAPAALPPLPGHATRKEPPRFAPIGDEDWDRAAARWFGEQETRQREAERRVAAERALRKHLARTERLAEGLRADLDNAAEAPRLRRMADALAANLHRVARGADHVVLEDLEDPAILHDVPLDPGKPPAASLERLYGRARRLDRAADRVIDHLDEVERRIADLQIAIERVGDASGDELEALERLVPRAPTRAADGGAELPWHAWIGPHGERVRVGRNERANRRLTFQASRGDDWWLHVRDRPGAHVVLTVPDGRPPSLELLLAAAQIALVHAKLPEGVAADVQYTRVRSVRPIPGEIGRVIVHDEKVLHVVRDPAALSGWIRE